VVTLAIAVSVNSTGAASVETVFLLTPEPVDTAVRKEVAFAPSSG
jgi:hypothetical protein